MKKTKNKHKGSKVLNRYRNLTWEEIVASWEKGKDKRIHRVKGKPFG